jgi:hypothetical protein
MVTTVLCSLQIYKWIFINLFKKSVMILRKRKTFFKKRKICTRGIYGCLADNLLIISYISKPRAAKGEHAVLVSSCVTVGCPPRAVLARKSRAILRRKAD